MELNKDNELNDFFRIGPRANRNLLESPIEEKFIYQLEKFLAHTSEIIPQYEVKTLTGVFRLDFLVTTDNQKIGFECDGADYHDAYHDEWRDAMILGTGTIDTIYRFRGKDIYSYINECMYVIYCSDPEIFSDRYHKIAEFMVEDEFKDQIEQGYFTTCEHKIFEVRELVDEDEEPYYSSIIVERRNKDIKGHWDSLYQFALNNQGKTIKELMALIKVLLD